MHQVAAGTEMADFTTTMPVSRTESGRSGRSAHGSHRASAADVDVEAVHRALQELQAMVEGDAELEHQCHQLCALVNYRVPPCLECVSARARA